jgi:hypothetical protein
MLSSIICVSEITTAQDEHPKLKVNLDKFTFRANEAFAVRITDESGDYIAGVTVGIQNEGNTDVTNANGLAQLVAPDVDEETEIIIKAQKFGYTTGNTTALVLREASIWEKILDNEYTLIVFAIVFLILVVLFVDFRRKRMEKFVGDRTQEISNEQKMKRYASDEEMVTLPTSKKIREKTVFQDISKEEKNIVQDKGPKVEEIRITRPDKDKKIVSVETEKEEEKKLIPRRTLSKHGYDWFEGTDDIRYEIDRLTGEIDEEGKDKWFEGIDDIRAKIDEKLKKKDKEKEEE